VVFAEFVDFVMVAKVAVGAIFPNVASVGIEKRMVTAAVRELDIGKGARRASSRYATMRRPTIGRSGCTRGTDNAGVLPHLARACAEPPVAGCSPLGRTVNAL
jgi:hypothetical protein